MSETITLGPHYGLLDVILSMLIVLGFVFFYEYFLVKKGRVNKEENGVES